MISDMLLNILLSIVFGVGAAGIFYFLSQKQPHHALWSGVVAFVLLIFVIALHVRNHIILQGVKESLTPKLEVHVRPEDWPTPALAKYKYPLQEYTLRITNDNKDSAPIEDLTIELYFPYIITSAEGKTTQFSGGPVKVWDMRKVEVKSGEVIRTEEEPPETPAAQSMSLSVQKWKENDKLVNSHIAMFVCREWPHETVFAGSIVVDLTKKPTGMIKNPDNIGRYFGKYNYKIMGKKFPTVKIEGELPEPKIDLKLAEHHYDQGKDLVEKGDLDKAIPEFSKALDLNPEHTEAYFERGMCYAFRGYHLEAKKDLDKVIERKPKHAENYYNRAVAREKMGEKTEEIREDYEKAFNLGFDRAAKPYLTLMLAEVNPSNGFLQRDIRNKKWLEKNDEFIEIIPHVSKEDFEIHAFRDKDNILKVLISNAFTKKVVLQFKGLEKLEKTPDRSMHTIKVTWFNGENKLYIDGALVDVYPKETGKSMTDGRGEATRIALQESELFRGLRDANPEKGSLTLSVSREEWLEGNGQFITIFPHILTEQLEIHAYRDTDNIFKVLVSNPFIEKALLQYSDLDKLKAAPNHPKHEIEIGWVLGEIRLYIDGNLADRYLG